jgi:hypothetical protein
MRTTVDIPDDLYQLADSTAARVGIPLRELITQGLRLALSESRPVGGDKRIAFPLLHSAQPGTLSVEEVGAAEDHAV